MQTEILALALVSAEAVLSVVHITLGLVMIEIAVGLGWHLTSKIEKEERKRDTKISAAVYEYVVSHGGEINVTQCAKTLNITKTQVMEAIQRLQKAKRVAVENAE